MLFPKGEIAMEFKRPVCHFLDGGYHNSLCRILQRTDKVLTNRTLHSQAKFQEKPPTHLTGDGQSIHTLNQIAYTNVAFQLMLFGGDLVGDCVEIRDVYFHNCTFSQCQFRNISFINCEFIGATFDHVQFHNTLFCHCNFNQNFDQQGDDQGEDILWMHHCTFTGIYGRRKPLFQYCDLRWMVWQESQLQSAIFQDCKLAFANIHGCDLQSVELQGCDVTGLAICAAPTLDLYFSDIEHTTVDKDLFLDHKHLHKENATQGGKSLRRTVQLCQYHNLDSLSGEYIYRAKVAEEQALEGMAKRLSQLQGILCGYGERPSRTLAIIFIQIFIFGTIYFYTGLTTSNGILDYGIWTESIVTDVAWRDYVRSIFFSCSTFTTVGYGNAVPLAMVSTITCCIQMMLGLMLTALWTGCILRKIAR